jgi:hypothetical protein
MHKTYVIHVCNWKATNYSICKWNDSRLDLDRDEEVYKYAHIRARAYVHACV